MTSVSAGASRRTPALRMRFLYDRSALTVQGKRFHACLQVVAQAQIRNPVNTKLLTCALLASTTSLALAQQYSNERPLTRADRALPVTTLPPSPQALGSDNCATPDPLTGVGSFNFDNTNATVTTDGQSTLNCIFYNLIALDHDVWFKWTAPQTGTVVLSTCNIGTFVDSKMAVYSAPTGGPYCPGSGVSALACADDIQGIVAPGNFKTRISFAATAGNEYVVQIGVYPGSAGGAGVLDLSYYVPNTNCQIDDGTTENGTSTGTAGTPHVTGWMQREGQIGQSTSVTTVSSAWGWSGTGTPLPAGLTANVGVWDDPNDDGDPTDGVLLAQASAPLVGQHTNALQAIPLGTTVSASGYFFIGAWLSYTNGFPAPDDISGCGGDIVPTGWLLGNASTTLDAVTLTNNSIPPFAPDITNGNLGLVFLLRADCMTGPPATTGTPFCPGDGTGTACPCANNSAPGANEGCLNSVGTGGKLRANGLASIANDTLVLHGTQMPNSSCLYFQGTIQASGGAGSAFGDGKRCAGGTVIRLKTKTNVAGASNFPEAGDPLVSVKGTVTSPGTRTYQAWYRNAAVFCTPSTFNLTNGLDVSWAP